eukprot:GHVR01016272.1.p1 GENE.GHVR01016272.1~~GHVR01016272.1.p1  ORF type:complete len:413 (+),score=49.68 GHVR01016272.1:216-1454(+)
MFLYAVGTLPLVQHAKQRHHLTQTWYADDASACGPLGHLLTWLQILSKEGPAVGYFPQPTKTYLVVHHTYVAEAERLFAGTGVTVVTHHRILGGVLGDDSECERYVKQKVQHWDDALQVLSSIAEEHPQAAYAAYTQSFSQLWTYLQRITPWGAEDYHTLNDTLTHHFIPAMFGSQISSQERSLVALPTGLGGLGLNAPYATAQLAHTQSVEATSHLVAAIQGKEKFDLDTHIHITTDARHQYKSSVRIAQNAHLAGALEPLSPQMTSRIHRHRHHKTSSWLHVRPETAKNNLLSRDEFRDGLALRYGRAFVKMPLHCDGCGVLMGTTHVLDCKKGGQVLRRHNEVKEELADILSEIYPPIQRLLSKIVPSPRMHWWVTSKLAEYGRHKRTVCSMYPSLTLTPLHTKIKTRQ